MKRQTLEIAACPCWF